MKFYRQSILLFGLVIPLLVAVVLIAGSYVFKSNVETSFKKNVTGYNSSEKDREECLLIESKILPERPAIERCEKLLNQKAASSVLPQLREIMTAVGKSELQETNSTVTSGKAGFGAVAEQNSSQIQVKFRGTFQAMQRVLLKLETKFPQLQLNDLKIDPNTSQSSLLNFQVNYTAWEN
jgi:hypothetical protein